MSPVYRADSVIGTNSVFCSHEKSKFRPVDREKAKRKWSKNINFIRDLRSFVGSCNFTNRKIIHISQIETPFCPCCFEREAILSKTFRPSNRAELFIWEIFTAGAEISVGKNRDPDNQSSPPSQMNKPMEPLCTLKVGFRYWQSDSIRAKLFPWPENVYNTIIFSTNLRDTTHFTSIMMLGTSKRRTAIALSLLLKFFIKQLFTNEMFKIVFLRFLFVFSQEPQSWLLIFVMFPFYYIKVGVGRAKARPAPPPCAVPGPGAPHAVWVYS